MIASKLGSKQKRALPDSEKQRRVAVYTRQSVEDASSEFGSLQAQREAVLAYVASQRALGWVALERVYEDAGYSGGNVERPAFRELLRDVQAGKVDVVAVYKLDRLSRSIADFVQLMDHFDEHEVEFVSITQQFSTTSSVGRLTLNMLVTFAQFERETIAERTRDKMLAARRRGMWTGGRIPLGYEVRDKRLVVNEAEAHTVRAIFDLFVSRGGLMATLDAMRERGLRRRKGEFTKDSLKRLLLEPWVIGQVRAGDELVKGLHEAIVTREIWEAARAVFEKPRPTTRGPRKSCPALLAGLLVCGACGSTMIRHFTQTFGRRYEAMVCQRALKQGAATCPGARVQLPEIEAFVTDRIWGIGQDPELLDATIKATAVEAANRKTEIEAQLAGVHKRRIELVERRANLVAAIGEGGPQALVDELHRVEAGMAAVEREEADARASTPAEIDATVVRRALTDLPLVWAELFPTERARIVKLLVERVVFCKGEVEMHMRPGGLARYAAEVSA